MSRLAAFEEGRNKGRAGGRYAVAEYLAVVALAALALP